MLKRKEKQTNKQTNNVMICFNVSRVSHRTNLEDTLDLDYEMRVRNLGGVSTYVIDTILVTH
ncbi:hypothetical protein Syun_021073 [Stephania yunnanensis]|uniref:Uncharacterized protein n=1 Tax=Stephania yunnanensis TaxID=152371 RepID=A0AAP0IF31_9MAGN